MKRSLNDLNKHYEDLSKHFVEGVIIRNGWKYREQENDNDIDGEIEVFTEERETTAKLLKVQLKATTNLKIDGDSVLFDCPVKFLNFCDVCDIPVVIIVYDVEIERAFWLWTQQYISTVLENDNSIWRANSKTVRIRIPISNKVEKEVNFYSEIESIATHGVNIIQQLRKQNTSEYYYTILEEQDNSTLQKRRLSARIYVERSFATSKDSMIELVRKINNKIYENNFNKKIFKGITLNDTPDYIWLYFYDDIVHLNHGLPFCRTEWVNDNKDEFIVFKDRFDKEIVEENIRVKWYEDYRTLNDNIKYNSISKREYFEKMLPFINYINSVFLEINKLIYSNENNSFNTFIEESSKEIDDMYISLSDEGYTPYECKDLNNALMNSYTELSNFVSEIKPNMDNKYFVESRERELYEQLLVLNYEFGKVEGH
ncbi:DUF4365 domain-containing protein [Peribacillus frigoritolerans]|uniref:DUF4365 domain-containing protein n=1 Tax=Peribacillus frigoritolerans TaxID=450367 RepID=UPI002E1BE90A|nr:DUF4365 domain-containing protein [Peribacillus frigoritolerans]